MWDDGGRESHQVLANNNINKRLNLKHGKILGKDTKHFLSIVNKFYLS